MDPQRLHLGRSASVKIRLAAAASGCPPIGCRSASNTSSPPAITSATTSPPAAQPNPGTCSVGSSRPPIRRGSPCTSNTSTLQITLPPSS
jgi:hypothetical protein